MERELIVLIASISAQFLAAVFALRLTRETGWASAWVLIAVALCLMGIRRGLTIYDLLASGVARGLSLQEELVALVISLLMLAGVARVAPVFRRLQLSHAALQAQEQLYHTLVDRLPEAVFLKDELGTYLSCNPRFARDIGRTQEEIVGHRDDDLFPTALADQFGIEDRQVIDSGDVVTAEVDGLQNGAPQRIRTQRVLVPGPPGKQWILGVYSDVTEHAQLIKSRETVITELQTALRNVKRLSGLIPICAGCKRIRNDRGYWEQVEQYVHDHSEAEFSHGLCPECMAQYYPDDV